MVGPEPSTSVAPGLGGASGKLFQATTPSPGRPGAGAPSSIPCLPLLITPQACDLPAALGLLEDADCARPRNRRLATGHRSASGTDTGPSPGPALLASPADHSASNS